METTQAFFFTDFSNSHIPEILKEIYLDKIYDPYLLGKKDLTIVDVGQNIGLVSYYFKDFAKIVIGLEPSTQHRQSSEEMVKFNKIENIKVLPYALSNENGKAKFYKNDNNTMFSLSDTVNKNDDFEEVETITMDKLMEIEKIDHIDLLKLDVEGWESQIIASEGFRNVVDKIDTIIGEYHSWSPVSSDLFANSLKDLGYDFKWLNKTEASVFICTKI